MDVIENLKLLYSKGGPLLQPAQNFKVCEKGVSGMFLINIQPGSKAYRYMVDIVLLTPGRDGQEYEKNLAKGSDEGLRSRNRNLCYEILSIAYQKTNGFGIASKQGELIYDCKSTLYTSVEIRNILINQEDTSDFIKVYCGQNARIRVSITRNNSGHELALDDMEQYISKESIYQEDRSIRTFLEMAVAQAPINNYLYTPIGAGKLFEVENSQNIELLNNGMVLRSGIAKGVRIVENHGTPCPALILDSKVCPFFVSQDLVATVYEINRGREPNTQHEWDCIRAMLQDLRVELILARNRTFGIRKLSDVPVNQIILNIDGCEVSLVHYYQEKFNYTIKYPKWRAVIPNFAVPQGEQPEYYPMEMCYVMPDQRVPLEKMDKNLSARLLKENSILPHQRMIKVLKHAEEMSLFSSNNPVFNAFGITIKDNSNEANLFFIFSMYYFRLILEFVKIRV